MFTALVGGVVELIVLAHHAERRWQDDLVARHPRLFNLTAYGRTFTPGFPEIGDGWRELVETGVGRIAAAIADAPSATVTIEQIKSKYATLHLYWRGFRLSEKAEIAVQNAVALAEARSGCTCEVCGRPGALYSRGDWLATACTDHARGEPVPVAPGYENLHVVRSYRAGKAAVLVCRRNVRETDSFVDVDPASLGIEEE